MKIAVIIALFIFGIVIASIVSSGLTVRELGKINNTNSLNDPGATLDFQSGLVLADNSTGSGESFYILDVKEVSKHSSAADCWMIVGGKVYNVTSYINAHPGGSQAIIPYCGKDGTVAFQTKDGQGSHSSQAQQLLSNYFIANLNQKIQIKGSGLTTSNPIQSNSSPVVAQNSQNSTSTIPVVSSSQNIILSLAEISKHSSVSDCWMIVEGKVYNVTSYITAHPGGQSAIIPYCGKDGTVAFQTKGGQGSHSQNANNILASYYIGDLNQQTTQTNVQTTQSQNPPQGTGNRESEDEEDDD